MNSSARPALPTTMDCVSPLTTRPDTTYKSGKVVQTSGATSDFDEKESGKMMTYLRSNKTFEESNVQIFRQEIKDVRAKNPTIVAFGNDAYSILSRNFKDEFKILKVQHYANYSSKENYREHVLSICR